MSCPHCDDTRWRQVWDDGVLRVERCACWREDAARTLLRAARIPPRYERCDLDTFVSYENEKLLTALRRARRFIEAFPVVEKGLLLIGPPGIGKTHVAVAVLRQVVSEKRAHGLYYDTRSLLNTIRSTYDPVTRTSEVDVLRPVVEAELLVLDDLGAERLTDWVDETMNFIVNTRYNDRRPTIFTSNYRTSRTPRRSTRSSPASASACTRGCARCASSWSTMAPTTATSSTRPAARTSPTPGRRRRRNPGRSCRPGPRPGREPA